MNLRVKSDRDMTKVSAGALIESILLVASVLLYFVLPSGMNVALVVACLSIFYAYYGRAVRFPVRIVPGLKSYASIEILFLTFYYILFFLPYQLYILGLGDIYRSKFLLHTYFDQSNKALALATIGLIAFCVGMRFVSPQATRSPTQSESNPGLRDFGRPFGLAILIVLIGLIALYQVAGWRSAEEGRYLGTTSGGALANGVYTLILLLCLLNIGRAVALLTGRRPFDLILWLALLVTALWTVRILLAGDRNSFFVLAIAAGGGLMTYRVRASWYVLIACLMAALALYNGVEGFRAAPDKSIHKLIENTVSPNQAVDLSSSSFTITTTTLKASIAFVPEAHDYGFGWYKLIGLGGIVPFIRGILLANFSGFTTTAELLSYYMLGSNAIWSVGTNLVSDIYIDFGVPGVAVAMIMVGVAASLIQKAAIENPYSVKRTIFYLAALGLFAELPRYSLDFPVRILAWMLLLFGIHEIARRVTWHGRVYRVGRA